MLFTILVDYRGGTYMSQCEAEDAYAALRQWSARVSDIDLKQWRLSRPAALRIVDEPPIAIEGLTNAWCASVNAGHHLLLLNIIATVPTKP